MHKIVFSIFGGYLCGPNFMKELYNYRSECIMLSLEALFAFVWPTVDENVDLVKSIAIMLSSRLPKRKGITIYYTTYNNSFCAYFVLIFCNLFYYFPNLDELICFSDAKPGDIPTEPNLNIAKVWNTLFLILQEISWSNKYPLMTRMDISYAVQVII